MEAPLNAREFLKRFHLPQLVRISQDAESSSKLACPDEQVSPVVAATNADKPDEEAFDANWSGPAGLSASRSLSDRDRSTHVQQQHQMQHEKSEWTYKPALRQLGEQAHKRPATAGVPARETARQEGARFWAGREGPSVRRSVDFESHLAPVKSSSKQAAEEGRSQLEREESIRLAPPSRRPALSKLQLNQPFLLYKAYKKLELCAYVIDLKNELNEKSGDPIYFPQNYPGKYGKVTSPTRSVFVF